MTLYIQKISLQTDSVAQLGFQSYKTDISMPRKPRQIHLARNVPQTLFNYYQAVTIGRSRIRAIINHYEIVVDDDVDADDPFVNHDLARKLCDEIMNVQKQLQRSISAMDDYSKRSGYSLDPDTSMDIDGDSGNRRQFLYTKQMESRELPPKEKPTAGRQPGRHDSCHSRGRSKPIQKVRFAETGSKPTFRPSRTDKFMRLLTEGVGNLASKTYEAVSPLRLSRTDTCPATVGNIPAEEKTQGKRLSESDHYRTPSPNKLLKVWHEDSLPEAYGFEDVGCGMNRPMTQAEIEGADNSVIDLSRTSPDGSETIKLRLLSKGDLPSKTDKARKSIGKIDFLSASKPCTDLVIYRRKPVVARAVPKIHSSADKDECVLTEVRNNATTTRKSELHAMQKLRLPCSVQASIVENEDMVRQ